jgi:GNAT superfamily N-acetyltransferase
MSWKGNIRRYEPGDRTWVRDLFVRVNRALAPADLRDRFEAYIELALREEIERIGEYYDPARGNSFWVAVDGPAVVGTVGLETVAPGVLELRRMYVDPARRREGLGALLLRHAEEIAVRQGALRIVLSTSEIQTAAIALYRSTGYRLLREVVATEPSNKTIGGGIRRFEFEKALGRFETA